MSHLTRKEWLSAETQPLDRYFLGGALAEALGPRYAESDVQQSYAAAVRRRCIDVLNPMVTMLEAEAGVGKTQGYLLPAMSHSAVTGKRVQVSTFTNDLKRQVAVIDGPVAVDAVEKVTGKRLKIAMRFSNREFPSPLRAGNLAGAMERENGNVPSPASLALRHLSAWAVRELEFAMSHPNEVVAANRGLYGTWADENPTFALDMPLDAAELWSIDPMDTENDHELLVRRLYDAAGEHADVVVCSHAMTVLDVKFGGRLLGGKDRPFGVAIIDEADRMADAARSIMSSKHSLRSLERTLADVMKVLKFNEIPAAKMIEIMDDVAGYKRLFERVAALADGLFERNVRRAPRTNNLAVVGTEDWLDDIHRAGIAAEELGDKLEELEIGDLAPAAELLIDRGRSAVDFVEKARDPKKAKGRTFISFSPVQHEPSMVVDAKFASRMLHRLWNGTRANGYAPLAEAVVVTSATLAQPGARGPARWNAMVDDLGLGLDRTKFDLAGSSSFSPLDFASLRFVLAAADAPKPGRGPDPGDVDPAHPYQARMVLEAASRPDEVSGRANVLVHVTSFANAEAVGALLQDALGDRLIVRTNQLSLKKALHMFSTRPNSVLVTPGAMQGINLPGLIDHNVICQLPYAPPEDDFGHAIYAPDEELGVRVSPDLAGVMRRIGQCIGRCTRAATDRATVWIADPRFPLPAAVLERVLAINRYPRNVMFLECVPARFRQALDEAEVFPHVPAEPPLRRAPARNEEEGILA